MGGVKRPRKCLEEIESAAPTVREPLVPTRFDETSRTKLPERRRYEGQALSFQLIAIDGRARRGLLKLPHSTVQTPCFMPVGTNGPMKMIPAERMEALGPSLMLNNTYHLGARLGKDRLTRLGGSHQMMQWSRSLLTDSGGFQMVSLLKLAKITEEGVEFQHPETGEMLMLTPEESMTIQNAIGADVMMALDDVISAVAPDRQRFEESVDRTTRWLKRCIAAHKRTESQNLWGIVQGGLHADLRQESLRQLKELDLPGFAIGGLSGGEAKSDFWRMVEICSRRHDEGLPEYKSRYLMGVGYPLDIVVCVALGCDLFDCVFPTRTARFGVALTDEGHMRLRNKEFTNDARSVDATCDCWMCKNLTRAFIHATISLSPSTLAMLSEHNIRYLHNLGVRMRDAIENNSFREFLEAFLYKQFPPEQGKHPPLWVRDALDVGAGISEINEWYDWTKCVELVDKATCGSQPHDAFQPKRQRKSHWSELDEQNQ